MTINRTDCGVFLLYVGGQFAARTAVCLYSLRQYYDGPVTLVCCEEQRAESEQIAAAGGATVMVVERATKNGRPLRRNGHYLLKTQVPSWSPYGKTLLIDTDTSIHGSVQPLFEMLGAASVLLTRFSDWQTLGNKMRGRVEKMRGVSPLLDVSVGLQLRESWPAINTGVVAWGNSPDGVQFTSDWLKLTEKVSPMFMADELVAQAMLPLYPSVQVVPGSDWNCSCLYDAGWQTATIIHYHGDKHLRDVGQQKWVPLYRELWKQNWANVRSWATVNAPNLVGLA